MDVQSKELAVTSGEQRSNLHLKFKDAEKSATVCLKPFQDLEAQSFERKM